MSIYQNILLARKNSQKLLAVLIDPEKIKISTIQNFIKLVNQSIATHIFVGGSTDENNCIEKVVLEIKKHTKLPVILFPGNSNQVTSKADGILFLSLISGRNPEYLIQQQIDAAFTIQKSGLEVIPTGYILIDAGKETFVQKVSKTAAISQSESVLILKTALTGEFSGKNLIYVAAGSGAIIRMVVIGKAFENNPAFFNELTKDLSATLRQAHCDRLEMTPKIPNNENIC